MSLEYFMINASSCHCCCSNCANFQYVGLVEAFSYSSSAPCRVQEEGGDFTYVERLRVPLTHGTLLIMSGATQDDWQVDPPTDSSPACGDKSGGRRSLDKSPA